MSYFRSDLFGSVLVDPRGEMTPPEPEGDATPRESDRRRRRSRQVAKKIA
jgi:hypothetical protein